MAYRFRLKADAGQHSEEGKTYSAGEIVESVHNLKKMFPDKFEVADRATLNDLLDNGEASVEDEEAEQEAEGESAGVKTPRGRPLSVEKGTKSDGGKIEKRQPESTPEKQAKKGAEKASATTKLGSAVAGKGKEGAAEARGTEVTDQWPTADEEGFKVFQRGEEFHVYEGDEVKAINKSALKKDGVEQFILDHME